MIMKQEYLNILMPLITLLFFIIQSQGRFYTCRTSCVGIGMLDEIPSVKKSEVLIENYSKIVCYTDGLSELKDANGKDIGTTEIISHIIEYHSC